MEAEYGLENGDIAVPYSFTQEMKYLCGEKFTVTGIFFGQYHSKEDIFNSWSISEEMLEPIESESAELGIATSSDFQTMFV